MNQSKDPSKPALPDEPLLKVRNLRKYFPVRGGFLGKVQEYVRAVEDVSFDIGVQRTLGLVGESGCGKTTVGRAILKLIRPTAGTVKFRQSDVFSLPRSELRGLRRDMQIIFQDPYGSLNPRMTVGATVGEPLRIHNLAKGKALRDRVASLLKGVGLPEGTLDRYPHEMSGGQRQRVGIARALALNPSFIVCDEPTSALDVSIRAQVIELLENLQRQHNISYLLISHDLAVVRHISHDVAVMYLGRIVEQAPTSQLFDHPRHPYSRILLSAIPIPDPDRPRHRVQATDEDIPSPIRIPRGCPFHPRCPLYALKGKPEICHATPPPLSPTATHREHLVSCHFQEETDKMLGEWKMAGS